MLKEIMGLYKMTMNLKKRIYTSIILFSFLFLMLINNFALGYFLIVIGIMSFLEFYNITSIFLKNKYILSITNLFFITYIFCFCAIFLILSNYFFLKMLLFGILTICIASDIGGFIFGKLFKGPKLTKISPNKTISGAIGSLIFSVLFTVILFYFASKNIDLFILIFSLITSIACQIGDLIFSFLKRKSLLKDTGSFLPGHGGLLDRIDGILLGLPIGFLTLLIFY